MSPAVTDENRGEDRAGADETPIAKRILIGEPLTNEELEGQLLPKRMALPSCFPSWSVRLKMS